MRILWISYDLKSLRQSAQNPQHFLAGSAFTAFKMRYLGIDFGLRKIGLAVSEGKLASPWKVLEVRNFSDAVEKVAKIIEDDNFDKVIIGLPEGKMGQNVTGFMKALKKRGFEAETADETLSSRKALETMIEQGVRQKKRQEEDAYSAAGILQNFLDNLS